jgi:uncharacterized protein with PIN domain
MLNALARWLRASRYDVAPQSSRPNMQEKATQIAMQQAKAWCTDSAA